MMIAFTALVVVMAALPLSDTDAADDFQATYVQDSEKAQHIRAIFSTELSKQMNWDGEIEGMPSTVVPAYIIGKQVNIGLGSKLSPGTYTLLIHPHNGSSPMYRGTFTVTDTEALVSITVTGSFSKEYIIGQYFEISSTVVTANYASGSSQTLSQSDFSYSPSGALKIDDTKVVFTHTHNGLTRTADVPIKVSPTPGEKILSSISASGAKTSYSEGEKFSTSGMTVTANYSDGTSSAVTEYTYLPAGELKTSDKAITISYTEKGVTANTSVAITVSGQGSGGDDNTAFIVIAVIVIIIVAIGVIIFMKRGGQK